MQEVAWRSHHGDMSARVVALHVAKGRRLPMRAVVDVEAEAGRGLVGDRYHGSRHRHVSLQGRGRSPRQASGSAGRCPRS